jgi:hypothetical protein
VDGLQCRRVSVAVVDDVDCRQRVGAERDRRPLHFLPEHDHVDPQCDHLEGGDVEKLAIFD